MDGVLIAIIALLFIGTLLMTAIVLGLPIPGLSSERNSTKSSLKNIVSAQRGSGALTGAAESGPSLMDSTRDVKAKRKVSSRLTLRKKLKYGQWKIQPAIFHFCEVAISALAFIVCFLKFNITFQLVSLLTGPIFMRWLLNNMIDKRFRAFDADYPSFLLSVVSLLKTGLNVMGALEAAAKGLEEGSLVRQEVEMMIDRLRYGVPEDKSIGVFGEDIFHSEIEPFVQALLLSRRVGGTLSDTLERLAKQVRRRQFFRLSAQAAVSMQRGSIWFIIAILCFVEAYLVVIYPEAVFGAIKDEMGWQIWQFSILTIMFGVFWVRQVTKIKI